MPPEVDRDAAFSAVHEFTVAHDDAGERVDRFLAARPELGLSRSRLQQLIELDHVTVDGAPTRASYPVRPGDRIRVCIPHPEEPELEPEELPLDILYEDYDLIVINKQRDLVVHPAPGHPRGTLVNALLAHCKDLRGVGGELRPGIVHRLDKDTTGVMVVAKNDRAHHALTTALARREVRRTYVALIHGSPEVETGLIDAPVGRDPVDRKRMAVNLERGREARTYFRVLERLGDYSLVECTLETGRTHQIRVHLAYIGHPVVGDQVYGPSRVHFGVDGQLLHAARLEFDHPTTGERLSFEAPLPDDMERIVKNLRGLRGMYAVSTHEKS